MSATASARSATGFGQRSLGLQPLRAHPDFELRQTVRLSRLVRFRLFRAAGRLCKAQNIARVAQAAIQPAGIDRMTNATFRAPEERNTFVELLSCAGSRAGCRVRAGILECKAAAGRRKKSHIVVITLRVMHHAERDDYDDDGCNFQELLIFS